MNKTRRKAIDTLMARLEDLRLDVEYLQEEEQEAFNNIPESLQESEKGEKMQESIDALEEALSNLEEAIENLDTAKGE
jgi:prefoldin subunit 5